MLLRKIQLLKTGELSNVLNTSMTRASKLRSGQTVNMSLHDMILVYDYLQPIEKPKIRTSIKDQIKSFKNFNLVEIAKLSDISYSTLWKFVNYDYNPKLDDLQKLIDAGFIK